MLRPPNADALDRLRFSGAAPPSVVEADDRLNVWANPIVGARTQNAPASKRNVKFIKADPI